MNHVVSDNNELALEPLLAACLKNTIFPIYLVESMKNPKEDRHKMVLKPLAENFSMMCSVSLKKVTGNWTSGGQKKKWKT